MNGQNGEQPHLDLDARKLDLEERKFEFERRRYEADGDKRAEELRKMRAESDKAELDASDLKIPYKKRAAYISTMFQGASVVAAAVALIASALSIRPILEAHQAKYESALANDEATRAKERMTAAEKGMREAELKQQNADHEKQKADSELANVQHERENAEGKVAAAESQLRSLNDQISEARAVSALEGLLVGLGNSPDIDPQGILDKAIDASPELEPRRIAYLRSVGSDKARPAMIRFYVLRALYSRLNNAKNTVDIQNRQNIRTELLALASDARLSPSDVEVFWSSLDSLFGPSSVNFYACANYNSSPESERVNRREHDSDVTRAAIVTLREYIMTHYGEFPACSEAILDSFDTRYEPELLGLFSSKQYQEVALFKYLAMSVTMGTLGGEYPLIAAGYTLQNISSVPTFVDEMLKENKKMDTKRLDTAQADELRNRFPLFVKVFSEPGLKRLRTCSPAILARLQGNQWADEEQLKGYCPVGTWRAD